MSDNQVKCIALNVNEDKLLLPNAAVAEIVPIKNIINVVNKPAWMLGYLDWGGHSVPLVSFEAMGGVRMPSLASGTIKAAILFTVGEDKSLPFISILVQGSPSILNVKEEEMLSNKEGITHPAVEDKVMIAEETYSVMNMENLEAIVKNVMTY